MINKIKNKSLFALKIAIIISGLLLLILGVIEKNLIMIIAGIIVGIIFPYFRFIMVSNSKDKKN